MVFSFLKLTVHSWLLRRGQVECWPLLSLGVPCKLRNETPLKLESPRDYTPRMGIALREMSWNEERWGEMGNTPSPYNETTVKNKQTAKQNQVMKNKTRSAVAKLVT